MKRAGVITSIRLVINAADYSSKVSRRVSFTSTDWKESFYDLSNQILTDLI